MSQIPSDLPIQPSPQALDLARQVLRIEGESVLALCERIGDNFMQALALILNCRGRVIVSGIGKSGHIARKIAATLASTGTPHSSFIRRKPATATSA